MKEVKAYKTTDDKLFSTNVEAIKHQRGLNIKDSVQWFAERHFYSGMCAEDAIDIILEYRDDLVHALMPLDVLVKKYGVEIYNATIAVYSDVYYSIEFSVKEDAEKCFNTEMDKLKPGEGIRLVEDGKMIQEFV